MTDDFLDRFFARSAQRPKGPAVANPSLTDPLGLQLLLSVVLELDAANVTRALRNYHTDMSDATAELFEATPTDAHPGSQYLGLLAWKRHVVKLVGINAPMPEGALNACVQPAHYSAQVKKLAYAHKSHLLLYYAGYERDPLEQYVALAAAAGSLACFGASFVLNETARTAVPAEMLQSDEENAGDMLGFLRSFPLPFLYCGLVKLEVEDTPGVWMRSYGAHRFGLPDFAFRAPGHDHGTAVFQLFSALFAYLRDSGRQMAPGHTMQVGEDLLQLRARAPQEWYLQSDGEMLVVEPIAQAASARKH